MTETDRQEQPYIAWLAEAEARDKAVHPGHFLPEGFGWSVFIDRRRAFRELRARDAEIASLKARTETLERRIMQLNLEADSAENRAAWTKMRAGK